MGTPEQLGLWLSSLGSVPGAVFGTLALLLCAYAIGTPLVASVDGYELRNPHVTRVVLGLNLVALVSLGLATAGVFAAMRPVVFVAPGAIAGTVLVWRDARGVLREWRKQATWPVAALCILLLATAGPSLCVPNAWDSLVYHVSLPLRWMADGRPLVYADLPYSAFPSSSEFLYWLVIDSGGIIAPKLLTWVVVMMSLHLLYHVLLDFGDRTAALVLVSAVAFSPVCLMVAGNIYVEGLLFLNTVLGARVLLDLRRNERGKGTGRKLAAIGIAAGGCAALKLTGVAAGIGLFVPFLMLAVTRGRACRTEQLRSVAVAGGVAACLALPFYIRPWMATGNPVYPYFARFFTDNAAVLSMSEFHHAIGAYRFGARSVAMFASAPMMLASGTETFDGSYGWQVVALLLLAGVCVRDALQRGDERPASVMLVAITCWLYVFWFFTAQQARFLFPALVPVACLAARGLVLLPERRPAAIALLALTLLSVPTERGPYYHHSWRRVAGMGRLVDYVFSVTDGNYLPAVHAVHDLTPDDARVMLLFEHRSLYLPRYCVVGTPFFQSARFTPPDAVTGPADVHAALTGAAITHVLVSLEARGPDQLPDYLARCQGFLGMVGRVVDRGGLVPIWRSEHHVLYQVARFPAGDREATGENR